MSTSQGTSERILSVVEAAKILRLSKSKTYELIHDNQLPHVRLGEDATLFPKKPCMNGSGELPLEVKYERLSHQAWEKL